MTKMIFIHIPKTGGTTIRRRLKSVYGSNLLWDKSESPNWQNILWNKKNNWGPFKYKEGYRNYNCIIGHFPMSKYQYLKDEGYYLSTWVRDPVERLLSYYNDYLYVRRRNVPKITLDLLDFAETAKNFYSSFFDVDLSVLDFIGYTKTFEKSFTKFENLFGIKVKEKEKKKKYRVTMPQYKHHITDKERNTIKEILAKDYELYDRLIKRVKEIYLHNKTNEL